MKIQKKKLESLKKNSSLNPHSDKVNDSKFIEHEFFDPNDLLQVKYEMIRKVELDGASVTEASLSFGFSRPSFYRLQDAFQKEGLLGLILKKKGPKEAHKLSEEVMNFVQSKIENDKSLKARGLKKLIQEKFDLTVHIRTIERAISRRKKKI